MLERQNIESEPTQWYAMRATYRRELTVKSLLDINQIESFVPMHHVIKEGKRGRKIRVYEPVIHNLIFINTSKSKLQSIKQKLPYLQYITEKRDGESKPIIVPEKQMNDFIAVSKSDDKCLQYVSPCDLELSEGTKIKIHGGAFDGVEAIFVRMKGHRKKSIVISIDNVIAITKLTDNNEVIEVLS
ncbi:MAG: UpxY family transcription antiterminator [Muribaculaceae bacterium]|nr:UpxY family transcription antiterminator [Muribaculaceae bacterium]